MTIVTLRASGPATPAEAWERYADPDRWSDWAPQINRVETASTRIAAGGTGRVVGPLGVAITFHIDEVDEARHTWAWRVRLGPLELRLAHGVVAHPRGSATWLRVEGPLPVVIGYAPIAQLAMRSLVAH